MKTNTVTSTNSDTSVNRAIVEGFSKARKLLAARRMVEATRIKEALVKYAGLDEDAIVVIVQNDNVLLDGRVNTMEQRENAKTIVHTIIRHPVKVDNNLKVNIDYAGSDVYEY